MAPHPEHGDRGPADTQGHDHRQGPGGAAVVRGHSQEQGDRQGGQQWESHRQETEGSQINSDVESGRRQTERVSGPGPTVGPR